jgi:hypothetical protein
VGTPLNMWMGSPMTWRDLRLCLLPLAICAVLGCKTAKVAEPLTANLAGSDPDAQMEFWHTLATRNLTSNDEAFHGLLLFLDAEDPAKDYAGRVELLKGKGLLTGRSTSPPTRRSSAACSRRRSCGP